MIRVGIRILRSRLRKGTGKAVEIPRLAVLRGPATSSTYLYFVRFRSWLPRALPVEYFKSFNAKYCLNRAVYCYLSKIYNKNMSLGLDGFVDFW